MKNFSFFSIAILFAFSGFSQTRSQNRAFLGVYGNYNVPLFQFLNRHYQWGPGLEIQYLTRKFTPFKNKDYSLRFGLSYQVSGMGEDHLQAFLPNYYSSGRQVFKNTYSTVNLSSRITYEKNKIFKPFAEIFIGAAEFDSEMSLYANELSSSSIYNSNGYVSGELINNSPFVFGLSAGYSIQLAKFFIIDTKVTYTQGNKSITFIDLNNLSYNGVTYDYHKNQAFPSLITVQLGLLFRIPYIPIKATHYTSSSPHQTYPTYQNNNNTYHQNNNNNTPPPNRDSPVRKRD
jgi:hypothetical protein